MTGCVAWILGRPSAGKSTFAQQLRRRLAAAGVGAIVLDGDEVRAAIVPAHGYSDRGRERFYATLANLAALIARQGVVAIVAASSHRRPFRERAKLLAPRFVEIWVDVSEDECRRRDAKGLYAGATQGRVTGLPGVHQQFEEPEHPDVIARGGLDEAAVERAAGLIRADASEMYSS